MTFKNLYIDHERSSEAEEWVKEELAEQEKRFAKIEAARNLGIPVIMIERPGGEPVIQAPSRSEIIDTVRETLKKI